jgi:hypothetical protein
MPIATTTRPKINLDEFLRGQLSSITLSFLCFVLQEDTPQIPGSYVRIGEWRSLLGKKSLERPYRSLSPVGFVLILRQLSWASRL